jgi:DNA (cytosine-5)-methyltransferase 1
MVQPGSEFEMEGERTLFEADYTEAVLEQEYIIETVCRDIEQAGYSVRTVIIPACAVGAPHRRERIFLVAHRADAGTESLRERENGIRECPPASHAIGDDAGRRGRAETRRSPEGGEGGEKEREWAWGVSERIGDKRIASDANQLNSNVSGLRASKIPQRETSEIFGNKIASGTSGKGLQGEMPRHTEMFVECFPSDTIGRRCRQNNQSKPSGKLEQNIPDWRGFPTQSPVRRRDDGFPGKLAGITFSRWRNESIKAFGNAIVPQVMYELFRAIDITNNKILNYESSV